jgi:hypothetical protein
MLSGAWEVDGIRLAGLWGGAAVTLWAGVLVGVATALAAAIIRRAEGPRWPVFILAAALVVAALALAV